MKFIKLNLSDSAGTIEIRIDSIIYLKEEVSQYLVTPKLFSREYTGTTKVGDAEYRYVVHSEAVYTDGYRTYMQTTNKFGVNVEHSIAEIKALIKNA